MIPDTNIVQNAYNDTWITAKGFELQIILVWAIKESKYEGLESEMMECPM